MRIALAQMNSTLGDFAGNRQKILEFVERAKQRHCDIVVFPESCLFGYHPSDLLERPTVVRAQLREFDKLVRAIPDRVAVVMGLFRPNPAPRGKSFFNSAAVLIRGRKPRFFNKELLPAYDVFDDSRHIEQGRLAENFLTIKGKRVLITVCEDIWAWEHPKHRNPYRDNPLAHLKGQKIDLILNLSASPASHSKISLRQFMVKKTATTLKAPMIYVNMVGGQDELIFDGGSFAVNAQGRILAQCRYFEEDLNLVDLETKEGGFRPPPPESERTRQTLVLGIRDFFRKTKNQKAIVGLSGGIDSAVVSCLAADALGPMQLTCVAMPGPFSSPESLKLARELARNLEVEFLEIPIAPIYEQMLKSLTQCLGELTFGTLQENLQARIRGLLLMALSNRESQSLVISTGNKSEYATGYTTLYGDMCGGLAPIGDLLKGEVYELARVYNQQQVLIPEGIINRAPSAELRPDQKDSDSLPPYAELDRAVRRLIENLKPANTKTDRWLVNALMNSEFKRWQAPPILKVSDHAFGRGRRFPVSNRARL